jgi:cyclopropane-fatty-acyl-phospholipid synthase
MTALKRNQTTDLALGSADIHGPESEQGQLLETRLTRYFTRLYKDIDADTKKSLAALHIHVNSGDMFQATDALMDAHYDAPDSLFDCFLDKRYRAYSMAYYGPDSDGVKNASLTLEQAQARKFALICQRADIQDGQTIFNVGCGFGSFETYLLTHYPSLRVVGITPSRVQAEHIRARQKNKDDCFGDGRLRLIQGAFDRLPIEMFGKGDYDRVISIGVLEHMQNMQAVLQKVAVMLKPGGKTFHHFITSKYPVPEFLDPSRTRIGQYFPGGRVWPREAFFATESTLKPVEQWFVNGTNYWRTLHEWHLRFWAARGALLTRVLDRQQFKYWNDYFYLCKSMFSPLDGEFYGNSHYLFEKPV